MEKLKGTVKRITFRNEENGYAIIKIKPEGGHYPLAAARDGTIAVVGTLHEIHEDAYAEFVGTWVDDPKWGMQFRAESWVALRPLTLDGIVAYLSSGIAKGIGPSTAQKIVDRFGMATLDILDREPERLKEVIKPLLAEKLAKAWAENREMRSAMVFLQSYGVSSRMALRIYEHYGTETVTAVQENPYTLADEVYGIGFTRADTIAQGLGMAIDAPYRLRAGLHYTLNTMTKDGHTYAPRALLIERALEALRINSVSALEQALADEIADNNLIADTEHVGTEAQPAIYLPLYFKSERGSAVRLRALNGAASPLQEKIKAYSERDWQALFTRLAAKDDVTLSEQQRGAVRAALVNKVSILTGGPGTGKTTTLNMVINAFDALSVRYALASPTGRAAKRLSEATGRGARTIHRLLGYQPGQGFLHGADEPLDIDALVIDETSMVDLLLFYDVLKALPPAAHLLLVGDVDQLPSVGAGNVLRDVIDSGAAFVTRLDAVFRQQSDSHIVTNAHSINHGRMPVLDNSSSDFFFFREDDPAAVAERVVDVVVNRLPRKFDIDPFEDVQVLAPMYRGAAGVNALNDALQTALNGESRRAGRKFGGKLYRVGDKVLQTRNNYEKDVFNGDVGRIRSIDTESSQVEIVFDNRIVDYEFAEIDQLMHAYCISTHRSQGSEYPVVVLPMVTQYYVMLQRNLLYTAVTRAKRVVVIVGSQRALQMAVENNRVSERYSGLLARLRL